MKTALGIFGALILVVGLAVGGWFLYWTVTQANVEQQYVVNTETQQYQAGLIAQLRAKVTAYDVATDPVQKQAIANSFCAIYLTLSDQSLDIADDLVIANTRICG